MRPSLESLWGFFLFVMTAIVIKFGFNLLTSKQIIKTSEIQNEQLSSLLPESKNKVLSPSMKSRQMDKASGKNEPQKNSTYEFRKIQLPDQDQIKAFKPPLNQQLVSLKIDRLSSEWLAVKNLKPSLIDPGNDQEIYGKVHQMILVKSKEEALSWPLVLYSQRQKSYGLMTGNLTLQISSHELQSYIELLNQKPFYESPETGFYYFKAESADQLKSWIDKLQNLNPKDIQVEVLQGDYARQ